MRPSSVNLANIIDACLGQMEAGRSIDEIVSGYAGMAPEKAAELREILQIAAAAQPEKESLRVPSAAQRASRQAFLSQAQNLQKQPGAAGMRLWLRFLRFFQQHVGSLAFSAATLALLFLALGSLNALPGDGLYPVKLAAEQAGVDLAGSGAAREERLSAYDSRRAEEVLAMIRMQRGGAVSFGGYLRTAGSPPASKGAQWQVAGIRLQLSTAMERQAQTLSGVYVEVKGLLGNQGVVQVESLEPRLETLSGTITRIEPDGWIVDSHLVLITADTQVSGTPQVGSQVVVRAASMVDSTQVLAISAEVAGDLSAETKLPRVTPDEGLSTANAAATGTATVTTTATATTTQTVTTTPTTTAMPRATATPEQIQSPEDNGDHHEDSTPKPEAEHEQDSSHE